MNYHTGTCKEVIKRIEKDVVTPDENCYMKKADMCGPINCKVKNFSPSHVSIDLIHTKFVNITTVCNVKNSTVMVDLRERECTVCQPSLRERLEVLDVCDDVLTQDCQDDPLLRPWTKFCDTNISQILNTGLTFKFEKSLPNRLVMDLVEQSLVPINDLLSDTLRLEPNNEQDSTEIIPKLSTPGQLRPQETTEDVSKILNLLAQQQVEARGSDVFPGEVVLPSSAPRPPLSSSSVYFDPVLNTRPLPQNNFQDTAPSSLTEFLNFQLQKPFSKPTAPGENITDDSENQNSFGMKSILVISTLEDSANAKAANEAAETKATISSENTMKRISTISSTSTVQIATTTKAPPITQQAQTASSTNTSHTRVTLSPSEVLQLCFLNSSYCDFSQNEVVVTNEEIFLLTSSTTPTTSTTFGLDITREPKQLYVQKKELKDKIRKCLLNGECGDSGGSAEEDSEDSEDTGHSTPAPPLVTSTPSYRDTELRRQVRERARACLFEGKCN